MAGIYSTRPLCDWCHKPGLTGRLYLDYRETDYRTNCELCGQLNFLSYTTSIASRVRKKRHHNRLRGIFKVR